MIDNGDTLNFYRIDLIFDGQNLMILPLEIEHWFVQFMSYNKKR